MSRAVTPTLILEWSPERVRALEIATGRETGASSIGELGAAIAGHRDVLVGVARGSVFVKALRLPRAGADDLRRLIQAQMPQHLPLPADQVAFDFLQTADQNADGALTLLGAMRNEDLVRLRGDLARAGLRPVRIVPAALAAPAAAAREGLADALVVDGSVSGWSYDVVTGGVLRYTRTAPAGASPAHEVQRTLAAAGVGPLPVVASAAVELASDRRMAAPTLAALGDAPPFSLELSEERVRRVRDRVATRTRFGALLCAAAALLVVLVWVDRDDAQKVIRRGEGTWARQLGQLRSIRKAEQAKAAAAVKVRTTLDRAFDTAQPLGDIATVVGDALPAGAWLTGLNVERGKPLQIRGTAARSGDVAAFVDALAASKRLRDVRLVFANGSRIDQTPVVQFSVTAVAVGNLPLPEPSRAKRARRAPEKEKT